MSRQDTHAAPSHDAPAHGHDAHAHEDPAEARDTIADFGFYAAFAIAGAALLLQAFLGDYGAEPRHAPGAPQHAASSAHEAR